MRAPTMQGKKRGTHLRRDSTKELFSTRCLAHSVLNRIDPEALRLVCPGFADELIGCQPLQRPQSPGKVMSHQKGLQIRSQPFMRLVVVAFYRGVFDGSIHVLDLSIPPWVTHLYQAMLDSMGTADTIKRNAPIPFRSLAYGKLDTVLREDNVDCVGHDFNQVGQEITSNQARRSWMQFGVGKL